MSSLRLFTSNRLEVLVDLLKNYLSPSLSSPLDQEIILVQSRGMERWLSMQLARHFGIWANARFPFPNAFLEELFGELLPSLPADPLFRPDVMAWRIAGMLPDLVMRKEFSPLSNYLGEKNSPLKRCQLAGRIADIFDQYLFYRPDMISAWERGEDSNWQASLWRELLKSAAEHRIVGKEICNIGTAGHGAGTANRDDGAAIHGEGKANSSNGKTNQGDGTARPEIPGHRASLRRFFLERLDGSDFDPGVLPARLAIFGISVLPPFHLEILAHIARFIPVNIFIMNPCRELWGYIASAREIARQTVRAEKTFIADELHLAQENSLLASMGTMGREFFSLILELGAEAEEYFEAPGEKNMLQAIQSDILNLRDRQKKERQEGNSLEIVSPGDGSVQIHSCHSPMREIEVLHDLTLSFLDEDAGLQPEEILVMAPDIEEYAPFIHAVFGAELNGPIIPYNLSDRSILKESPVIDAFFSLLSLSEERFRVLKVLDLLETESVTARLGLKTEDTTLIKKWIRETRIRWGMDEDDRKYLGLPQYGENTWKEGLSRLVLGYALDDGGLFEGILPYRELEGSDTAVLGAIAPFMEKLFDFGRSLREKRTLSQWSGLLNKSLDTFFLPTEGTARSIQQLRSILDLLRELGEKSGFQEAVPLEVIRSWLQQRLTGFISASGFLSGGITFCSMLPMRAIPFKIICLLGMNDNAFPRITPALDFDLMAKERKLGDRSRRIDDRYLFLESLLSAREILYISYVGQGMDNKDYPPSVLVSELLDYIEGGFETTNPEEINQDRFIIKHRLQAFNPGYFKKGGKLFSYSEENYRACLSLLKGGREDTPFLSEGLPLPEDSFKTITLDDLCRFYKNPLKYLFNRRLGLYLEFSEEEMEERETFHLSGLDRYFLMEELVERVMDGQDIRSLYSLIRARGILPHGMAGKIGYGEVCGEVENFCSRFQKVVHGAEMNPLSVEREIAGFTLKGRIRCWESSQVRYRCTKVKKKDIIECWIYHLALNLSESPGYPRQSLFLGEDDSIVFKPVDNADELLKTILLKYWYGLSRVLLFFPAASFAFVEKMKSSNSRDAAVKKAQGKWLDVNYGEGKDPYNRLCFGDSVPLDQDFQDLALEILLPLFAHKGKSSERV